MANKSKPFSNGTEYHWFLDNYCYQCYRYHEDEEGFPTKNSCKVEKAIALYQFDDSQKWPDEIVQTGKKYHHCVLFCNKDDFVRAKPQRKPMIGQMALEEQEDG